MFRVPAPQRKGIVRTESHLVRTYQVHHMLKHGGVVYQGIQPKAAEVVLGRYRIVHSTKVRSHIEAVLYATDRPREGTTTMGKGHAQTR